MSVELLLTAIGTIGAVATSTAVLAYWLGRKFAEIDKRFEEVDRRFNTLARATRGQFDFSSFWALEASSRQRT